MIKFLTIIALIGLLVGACTAVTPQPTEAPSDTPVLSEPSSQPSETVTQATPTETVTETPPEATESVPVPVAYGPKDFPADVGQLIGQPVENIELLNRRPAAVKVQLFPRSQRPPWGVSLADIVYDYYQNFGLTRLHAIFLSRDAETVGPVRSARLLDAALVEMYQSVFAFGSAEQRTYSKLFNSDISGRLIVEGNSNCPPLCRVDPNGTNELVANTADMTTYSTEKGVDNVAQDLSGMYFNSEIPAAGQPAPQVFVRFSISAYNLWDYNPENGRYLRYQDSQEAQDISLENVSALMDKLTNEQIAADNVVVLFVPHHYAFGTHPGVSEVVEINLSGSGPAYAFREGQVYQVVWNRPSKNSVLFLTFQDGSSYPFKPGNTWFEVMGTTTQLKNPTPGLWRFDNQIP
jgi:Protein of unknown function (DUF3048) C-terminal domain/Protein of unknown function (DUF3048) N-terminal domain